MERKRKRRFADAFYSSYSWRRTRESFIASRQGLCEMCLAAGIYTAGTEVHHKIRLTPQNINDPAVTLDWNNLELLCDECHERKHGKHQLRTDEFGHVDLG